VFLIICDVVCNILKLINVRGFAEMHVEKQNIYKKLATWQKKTANSSLRNTFSQQSRKYPWCSFSHLLNTRTYAV